MEEKLKMDSEKLLEEITKDYEIIGEIMEHCKSLDESDKREGRISMANINASISLLKKTAQLHTKFHIYNQENENKLKEEANQVDKALILIEQGIGYLTYPLTQMRRKR